MSESLTFSLAIHGAPGGPGIQSALGFLEAALIAGHSVYRVFFYHEGVMAAEVPVDSSQDSYSLDVWLALKSKYDLELSICVGAATRRNLNADSNDGDGASIHPGFEVVGLGQLIDAMVQSDRFVTFAA